MVVVSYLEYFSGERRGHARFILHLRRTCYYYYYLWLAVESGSLFSIIYLLLLLLQFGWTVLCRRIFILSIEYVVFFFKSFALLLFSFFVWRRHTADGRLVPGRVGWFYAKHVPSALLRA